MVNKREYEGKQSMVFLFRICIKCWMAFDYFKMYLGYGKKVYNKRKLLFMTPKEKAFELKKSFTDKLFNDGHRISKPMIKLCALIAVDEILKSFDEFMDTRKNFRHELEIEAERYWLKVKEEIEHL